MTQTSTINIDKQPLGCHANRGRSSPTVELMPLRNAITGLIVCRACQPRRRVVSVLVGCQPPPRIDGWGALARRAQDRRQRLAVGQGQGSEAAMG
jgi:hypothetical protein